MSDNSNLEINLSKVEKHLADAGKQAVSKAEATIVEAVYWLHQTTAALKQSYDEKIVQLEAELQSAHEKIASLTSTGSIEELKYFSNKPLVDQKVPTSYLSTEELIVESVDSVNIEELSGHIEPALAVEKDEKIIPTLVAVPLVTNAEVEKKVHSIITTSKPVISNKKNKNI